MPAAPTETPRSAPVAQPRTRRVWRWLVRLAAGVAALVLLAAMLTAALDARDARRYAAPGDLVELADGRVLHLQVAGAEHDGATVVLDAGAGGFSPMFAWLQADLADWATVVAYDRPGYGWSSPADRAVDAHATAADLHEALAARGLPGPYVLVGHSLGGLYVRAFAHRYPDDVAGMVLLDPAHEHQLELLPTDAVAEMEQATQSLAWAARIARLGVFRLFNPNDAAVAGLPDPDAAQLSALTAGGSWWRASAAEAAAFDQLAAATPPGLGETPARVISASDALPGQQDMRAAMDTLHRQLADGSELASHQEIDGADHLTLLTDADHARAVAEIVTGLLDEPTMP